MTKISRILGAAVRQALGLHCIAVVALGLLAAGCGQKGPLYFPSPTEAKKTTVAKPPPLPLPLPGATEPVVVEPQR